MIRKREFEPQRERWEQLDRLLKETLRLPADERDAYLESQCGDDRSLLSEARSLLSFDDEEPDGEDSTPGMGLRATWHLDHTPPEEFGGYRIVERLGGGGMGVVYLAEQQSPKRLVALKLIRPGALTEDFRVRFALEAEALGKLKHAAIAQIYEAGTLEVQGVLQPYIAMEHIDGVDLEAYLKREDLDLEARCELLLKLCDGVQHAHLSGVIHRDLSPRNILVDREGNPKIIDFGVARLADSECTSVTATGQFLGTMGSMSPEQCQGRSDLVDSRTDVYSLGVLGYRILAGRDPYDLQSLPVLEAVRVICEQPAPSIGKIRSELSGDLETVINKALEKDPDRRYSTAAEFAADIRRFQRREPVSARPATVFYQLRRLAGRHRAGVAILVTVLLGALAMTAQAFSSQRAFLLHRQDSFLEAMAVFSLNRTLSEQQREDLVGAAERVESRFKGDRALQADLHDYFASMFGKVGLYQKSDHHAGHAYRLHREVSGDTHPKTLRIAKVYADTRAWSNDLATSKRICEEFSRICSDINGREHETTLRMLLTLANLEAHQGNWSIAEAKYQEIHEIQVRRDREGHPDRLEVETSIARAAIEQGRLAEGSRRAEAAYRAQLREQGIDNSGTTRAQLIWADALLRQGELERAKSELDSAWLQIERFGEQHLSLNAGRIVRARWHAEMRQFDAALEEVDAVLIDLKGEYSADHWKIRRGERVRAEVIARIEVLRAEEN